jgi:hypothetical protein
MNPLQIKIQIPTISANRASNTATGCDRVRKSPQQTASHVYARIAVSEHESLPADAVSRLTPVITPSGRALVVTQTGRSPVDRSVVRLTWRKVRRTGWGIRESPRKNQRARRIPRLGRAAIPAIGSARFRRPTPVRSKSTPHMANTEIDRGTPVRRCRAADRGFGFVPSGWVAGAR